MVLAARAAVKNRGGPGRRGRLWGSGVGCFGGVGCRRPGSTGVGTGEPLGAARSPPGAPVTRITGAKSYGAEAGEGAGGRKPGSRMGTNPRGIPGTSPVGQHHHRGSPLHPPRMSLEVREALVSPVGTPRQPPGGP